MEEAAEGKPCLLEALLLCIFSLSSFRSSRLFGEPIVGCFPHLCERSRCLPVISRTARTRRDNFQPKLQRNHQQPLLKEFIGINVSCQKSNAPPR